MFRGNRIHVFCLLLLLSCTLVQHGCGRSQASRRTTRELTYFESASLYVGCINHGPINPTDVYRTPDSVSVDVFWTVADATGRAKSPEPLIYYAGWSSRLGKIIVLTYVNIFSLSAKSGEIEVLWKTNGVVQFGGSRRGVSDDGSRLIVTVFDTDKGASFLTAVDMESGISGSYEIPYGPSGVVFTTNNTAMVYVGKDVVTVKYDCAAESWGFTSTPMRVLGAILAGAMDGEPVWTREVNNVSQIRCAGKTAELPGRVWRLVSRNRGLLCLSSNGGVYRIDSEWKVSLLDEIDPETIIGSGLFSNSLWVATEDGKIRTYGLMKKELSILLPKK